MTEQANALAPDASNEFKERMMRNVERTWLYVFIADKSFGITTGRSLIVGWNELPPCPCQWWKKPMTNPSDRMISGLIEIRVQLVSFHSAFILGVTLNMQVAGSLETARARYQNP